MLIKYDVRTGIPEITAGGCKVIEDSQRIFMYSGEFTGSNDITAGELNEMKIQDLCGLFYGPFMAVCFRKQDGSLKLRQHFFGSPVNVWLTRKEHSIFISTSLKELLGISGLGLRAVAFGSAAGWLVMLAWEVPLLVHTMRRYTRA